MKNCKRCERALLDGELDFCPACASGRSHKAKRVIEIGVPIVIMMAGFAIKLLRKKG